MPSRIQPEASSSSSPSRYEETVQEHLTNGYTDEVIETECMITGVRSDREYRAARVNGKKFPDHLPMTLVDRSWRSERPDGVKFATVDEKTGIPENGTRILITWHLEHRPRKSILQMADWNYVD